MIMKIKEYYKVYQLQNDDSADQAINLTSVSDAQTTIGFKAVYDTSSPTNAFALEDTNTTLVVTRTFSNAAGYKAYSDAIGATADHFGITWPADTSSVKTRDGKYVLMMKREFLASDDSVESTETHNTGPWSSFSANQTAA